MTKCETKMCKEIAKAFFEGKAYCQKCFFKITNKTNSLFKLKQKEKEEWKN